MLPVAAMQVEVMLRLAADELVWLDATPDVTKDEAHESLTTFSHTLAQSFDMKAMLEGSLRFGLVKRTDEGEVRRPLGIVAAAQAKLQEIVRRCRELAKTGKDRPKPVLKYHGIDKLPVLAEVIEGRLADAEDDLDIMRGLNAPSQPMVTELDLDDVDRQLIEDLEFTDTFAEQLQRWQRARRTAFQRDEIDRLMHLNNQTRSILEQSQAVAKELRSRTLERTIATMRPNELMDELERCLKERGEL